MDLKFIDLVSRVDFRLLLVVGLAVWFIISGLAVAFCVRFFTNHWRKEDEFKKNLQVNSEKVKVDLHDIRNFLNKYEGSIQLLTRDSENFKKDINYHGHQITAIRTTLHNKGVMKFDFLEGGDPKRSQEH